ncbi:hypothetical protein D3C80_1636420 [compost metagenome]
MHPEDRIGNPRYIIECTSSIDRHWGDTLLRRDSADDRIYTRLYLVRDINLDRYTTVTLICNRIYYRGIQHQHTRSRYLSPAGNRSANHSGP